MSPSAASSPAGGAPCRSSHTWRAQTDRPGPHPGPQARRGEAGAVVTGSCRPGLGQLAHPHQLRAEEKGTGRGRTGWRLTLRPGSWEPERLGFKSQLQTLLIQCLKPGFFTVSELLTRHELFLPPRVALGNAGRLYFFLWTSGARGWINNHPPQYTELAHARPFLINGFQKRSKCP